MKKNDNFLRFGSFITFLVLERPIKFKKKDLGERKNIVQK